MRNVCKLGESWDTQKDGHKGEQKKQHIEVEEELTPRRGDVVDNSSQPSQFISVSGRCHSTTLDDVLASMKMKVKL